MPPDDSGPAIPPLLTFPDLPRLELDELLGQLVDRAHEVMVTQGRLRGLLRASQMVTHDLALPVVLRRIVEAARDLVGARYAALGVISPIGGLSEFVHTGMPPEMVATIGDLPQGKGLLGGLLDDPEPIGLRHITDDARSSGFPPEHPPISSFLGVPIRIRDDVFGNLYLAESTRGEFGAEDEELAKALASTAAVAIENARLYEVARSRGRWLQAQAAITGQILSADEAGRPLQLIAETTLELARVELVTVVLPAGPDELQVDVAVGSGAGALPGLRVPRDGSLSGDVLGSGTPLRSTLPDSRSGFGPAADLDLGPVLAVPLLGSTGVRGVLWAARRQGGPAFGAEELDMVAGFANQAAVAIELVEARAEQQRTVMLEEHDRIAVDLHDHVIQRLFAAGLTLQSTAATLAKGPATERILATVDDLDSTIRQIRTTIFQLHPAPWATDSGLRARLLDVAIELTPALGFEPALRFSGLLDTLPEDVADDAVAVAREALTNVTRHAHAHSAEVELAAGPDRLTLQVRDDGDGVGPSTRRSGLDDLGRRAERRGGRLELADAAPHGTCLSWSVPLI